jgi:hypothetical protein
MRRTGHAVLVYRFGAIGVTIVPTGRVSRWPVSNLKSLSEKRLRGVEQPPLA